MLKVSYFQLNQQGIDALKDRCFNGAQEFSYFRKGEWTGVEASIMNAVEWATAHPEWINSARTAGADALRSLRDVIFVVGAGKEVITWIRKRLIAKRLPTKHLCRRVICSTKVPKADIKRWEKECGLGSVATIPYKAVGPFAYIVSDKMWAIFTRFGQDDLRGIEGQDQEMISLLKARFDREFNEISVARGKRLAAGASKATTRTAEPLRKTGVQRTQRRRRR